RGQPARPRHPGSAASGVHRPEPVSQPDGAPRHAHQGPQHSAPRGVGARRQDPLLPAQPQRSPRVQPRTAYLHSLRSLMLTDKRQGLRPVEYPAFLPYRDAIRHAYWLHTEFNLSEDVHDYRSRVSTAERTAIRNTMLAIAQVEVAVKSFWGDLFKLYPKPEVGAVGYTF